MHDVLPVLGVLNALSALFVLHDGHRRGRMVWIAVTVTLLLPFPLGLVVWFVFRPPGVQRA